MYYSGEDRDLLSFLIKQELDQIKDKEKASHYYLTIIFNYFYLFLLIILIYFRVNWSPSQQWMAIIT